MFCQLFGKFLIEKEVIDKNKYNSIMERLAESRAKLGVIAVADDIITEKQANEINHLQTTKDARFGEIAVGEGYITEEQLDVLLKKQGSAYAIFLSVLSEAADISVSKVDELLKEFQKEHGFTNEDMDGLKNDDLEQIVPIFAFSSKSYVTDICRLALSNIERFVTSDFYIDRIKHISQLEYRCLAGQKLEGDLDIIVGFASVGEQTAIVDIANGFSHSNIANLGIEVYDAIGEFTNCISGLFATALSKKGSMLEITPQFAYENQFAKGDAYVLPIHIHDSEVLLFISASDETKAGDMPVVRKIMAKAGGEVTLDSKGTVVIVDDSGMSRKILRDILEEAGYAVLAEATDGLEGVLAYKTYYPDIITLDITMPNMDGTEALKEIKAYDSNAKVIMITAAGQQHKVIEALKLGAKRFITKPFDKEEILKNIEEVLEG